MRLRRLAFRVVVVLTGSFLLLAIPGPEPQVAEAPAESTPFVWAADSLWHRLDSLFIAARESGCDTTLPTVASGIAALEDSMARRGASRAAPSDPFLDHLELAFFEQAPAVAACPEALPAFLALQQGLRRWVKEQSRGWDLSSDESRRRLYRLLYGSRSALEEVSLHHPGALPALLPGVEEPSATPSTVVAGVRVHSGDLLVSRGGYPTSALIARGSDYPGNFSHVALVHVDSATGEASTIEAHIESGVAIASAEAYLRDKKLRILVLRPRADLPALLADPMLPHRVATAAITRARSEHIPYDFTMDYQDDRALFCSEVASSVYRDAGVTLWTGLSTITAPGLRRWLASFGVRQFTTQEPSDLEYDPQLVVVAEWRDTETLQHDRIDNAVIDAMLEGAERGDALTYPWYQLPVVRVLKGWSLIRERFGAAGPVPEGMSARAALRNRAFGERQRKIAAAVAERVAVMERDRGYPPTYWTILELARTATAEHPPA